MKGGTQATEIDLMKNHQEDFNPTWNLITLCLASFTVVTGFGVILPFFPLYVNSMLSEIKLGLFTVGIALQIGIMTSAFMFTRFLLAPAYGDLSDSVGRKPIILVGMSMYAVLMVGFGLAFDFPTLLILRAMQGVASSAVWPVGEALIVDTTPDKKTVGRNLGFYMMSMQAGMALGPFIGFTFYFIFNDLASLPELLSYKLTFACVGVLGILATLIVAMLVTDPSVKHEDKSIRALYFYSLDAMLNRTGDSPRFLIKTFRTNEEYRTTSVYAIYLVALINGFGFAMIFPLISLFLYDYYELGPGSVVLLIGLAGIPALTGGPIGGYISDRIGRKYTVCTSGLMAGLLFLSLGVRMALVPLAILFAIHRFLFGVMQPAFRALQSDLIPEKVRGKEFGVVQAIFNFGAVLGPIVGGLLYDVFFMANFHLGSGVTYLGAGIAFALAGLLALFAATLLFVLVDYSADSLSYLES